MRRVLFFNFGDFSKKLLEDNMIKRIIALAMVVSFSFSMVACGPSKEYKALQAQYAALQQAPVTPVYQYQVTKPFILMGALVSNPQELANALQARPAMVTCVVQSGEQYADMMCEADMTRVGYQLMGKSKKKGRMELVFKDNSSAGLQAAQAQRQQQLQALQSQMNQQQMADSQANQTYATVGITAGTLAVGIIGSILMAN